MTGSRELEGMIVFPVGQVMNAWLKEDLLDAWETFLQELLDDWIEKMRKQRAKRRKNEKRNQRAL